jgi:3-mercaptopyruvate sulfurtransferase SseA
MGHEKVSILDGGLPRWIHEGFEVDSEDLSSSPASEKGEVLLNGDIQVSRVHMQVLSAVSACIDCNSMGRLR